MSGTQTAATDVSVVSSQDPGTCRLPADCALLPIETGALLVSRSHAVFCRIPAAALGDLAAVLDGHAPVARLPRELRTALEGHGFFAPPRAPKRDVPSVQLQLTNDCNLACGYCCTNSGTPRENEVCFERMRDVVRQIPEELGSDTNVALLGGEPLLVPWALTLAKEILDVGLSLTIFTNGVPLARDDTARRTAELASRGAQIRVSLAGPTKETCDTVSGAQRFDDAIEGVRKLAKWGALATVDVMLVPQHVDTIARALPTLRPRLPEGTKITLGVLYLSGRERGEHVFPSRARLDAALDQIAFEAGETIPAAETGPLSYRREGCTCALGKHIHVRSDGALFNCFKMEEKVGELDGIGFAAAARAIRSNPHPASATPSCRECSLVTICGGGCRSENLLYTGDPSVPPCGPWRVRVLCELLAEDRICAVEWPIAFLVQDARDRGIAVPDDVVPHGTSRHLTDV